MNRKTSVSVVRPDDWSPEDQAAWREACVSGGIFEESGPLGHYPKNRLSILAAAYGRWFGFLAARSSDHATEGACAAMSQQALADYVAVLSESLAPRSVATYVHDLRIVAHVLAPNRALDELDRLADHLRKTARPRRNKRTRVVPAEDLFALGFEMMNQASATGTPLQAAQQFRDGLMIALLAACPIRIQNLASIEVGRHLVNDGHGFRLVFSGHEVKNRRALEFPLPPRLTEPIQQYLSCHRPILLGRRGRHWKGDPGDAFWISHHGTALKRVAIWGRITNATREHLGIAVNPHLFRDCAATSIAIGDPKNVGIIRSVLGHSNPDTAEKYYNQARSLEAARRHQGAVDALRNGGPS